MRLHIKTLSKYFFVLILTFSLFFIQSTKITKKEKIESRDSIQTMSSGWADSIMSTLTLDEKIGQLFMVAAYPKQGKLNKDHILNLINTYHIGGLIFFKSGPVQQAKLTNYYQSVSDIPLMTAGDYEWGLSMRMDSTVKYPKQMMLGAIQDDLLINELGNQIGKQLRRIGIHVNFAPVIDVNNNSNNPVINYRSFGEIKENVSSKGLAYMIGLQQNKILATGKHFPGHGDTQTDSHYDLPIITHTKERIDSVELFPFIELINSGLGAVMIAHLNIPSLDPAENKPSSLSKPIVTNLLKNKLGFKGLIFTDALGMKGVTKYYEPGETEVEALIAGADVLLMPKNIPTAFEQIKKAIKKGKISQKEIDEKCKKILIIKNWLGLNEYSPIEIDGIYSALNNEEAKHLNRKLTEAALTLALNKNKIIPFRDLDKDKIASVSIENGRINNFQERLLFYDDVTNYVINKNSSTKVFNKDLNTLASYDKVIISIHKMRNTPPYYGINQNTLNFIDQLSKKTKVVLVLFGNAYALERIKNPDLLHAVLVSYNDLELTRDLSAQLLFGGISAQGKLPVSAGKYFPAGSGEISIRKRLKYTDPFELGLNTDTIKKIDSVIYDAISKEATPGATIMAIKEGSVFFYKSYGYHTYMKKRKVKNSDIYDLASITKIASTVPSLMKLFEQNKINITRNLSDYLPELKNSNKKDIVIKDILAHQASLIPWIPFYRETYTDETMTKLDPKIYSTTRKNEFSVQVAKNLYISENYRDTIYERIKESELRKRKGYKYSDLGFILFNKMIEDITGMKQNEFVNQNFYEKLGATTLGYLPLNNFSKDRILPTEKDIFFRKQTIQGYVHDYAAAMTGGVNGHAGLFSNANDLAKLLQMYLNGGKYGRVRYFSNLTLKEFTSCAFCKSGNRRGLGFDRPLRPEGGPSSQYASDISFGHSGFTGTLVWVDPKYDFVYIFLSNRTYPASENNKLLKMDVRTKIQELFYKSFPEVEELTAEK